MLFVSGLLGRRAPPRHPLPGAGAELLPARLRWSVDGTRLLQLAADNRIGRSTAYRNLHEGIDVLVRAAPSLRGALLTARAAGHPHVTVDGTLIVTDRCRALWPTAGVDLWRSGKHAAHGGTIQVVAAPDGWPM